MTGTTSPEPGDDDVTGTTSPEPGDDDVTGTTSPEPDDDDSSVIPTPSVCEGSDVPPDLSVMTIQDLRDTAESLEPETPQSLDARVDDAVVTYINAKKNFFLQQRDGAGIFAYLYADDPSLCGGLHVGDVLTLEVLAIKTYANDAEITEMNCLCRTGTGEVIEPLDVSETGLTSDVIGQSVKAIGTIVQIDGKSIYVQGEGPRILVYNNSFDKFDGLGEGSTVTVQGPAVQYYDLFEIKIDDGAGMVSGEVGVATPTPNPSSVVDGSIAMLRELAASLQDSESMSVNVRVTDAIVTYVDSHHHFYLQRQEDAGIFVSAYSNDTNLCGGLDVGDMLQIRATKLANSDGELEISNLVCEARTGTQQTVAPVDVSSTGIPWDRLGSSGTAWGTLSAFDGNDVSISAYGNTIIVLDDDSGKFAGFSLLDTVAVTGPLIQAGDERKLKIDSAMGIVEAIALGDDPYYAGIDTDQEGEDFKLELHNLIRNHTVVDDIYGFFTVADLGVLGCEEDKIGDIYSSTCWTPEDDQCGTYHQEGDCYNKEHSWPASWSNDSNAVTHDLHALFPTDGWVNNQRAALPYAVVDTSVDFETSSNGCKIGMSDADASNGMRTSCFEPADNVKGDLARAYFYISVCYYGEDSNWDTSAATDGTDILPWEEALLRSWDKADPVSAKEIERNNSVFLWQGNRNPFVDHPEWVDKIVDF